MTRFSDPEPLTVEHRLDGFTCGDGTLDRWLSRYALIAQGSRSARVFVVTDARQDGRVVAFYALATGQVARSEATVRVAASMPRHPIPVVVLGRLAVDSSVQSIGLGAWLLKDALLRVKASAGHIGIRAVLVHASDEDARRFYLHHGFEQSPTARLHLQLLLKDIH